MNAEQMLPLVEDAITKRTKGAAHRWAILYLNGNVQCLPVSVIKDDGNVFGYFNDDELEKGFTNNQWNQLTHKIATFMERRTYKCQPQKP